MANTSSRTLRLLSLLQTHRHWSGEDLSARLEVSIRTLRGTWTGCVSWAIRSRPAVAWTVATSSRPVRCCRRWCSTTRRRGVGGRPADRCPGLGRGHRGVLGAGAGQAGPGDAPGAAPAGRGGAHDDRTSGLGLRCGDGRPGGAGRGGAGVPDTERMRFDYTAASGSARNAMSSRCGWSRWAAAGTWWPTTWTGTTGAASGWTGWPGRSPQVTGSAPGSCPPPTRPRSSGPASAACRAVRGGGGGAGAGGPGARGDRPLGRGVPGCGRPGCGRYRAGPDAGRLAGLAAMALGSVGAEFTVLGRRPCASTCGTGASGSPGRWPGPPAGPPAGMPSGKPAGRPLAKLGRRSPARRLPWFHTHPQRPLVSPCLRGIHPCSHPTPEPYP